MKPAAFHRGAEAEFIEALQYFTDISPELGGRFYDEIERLLAEAGVSPGSFRYIRKPVRRHFSRKFPYGIVYVERPDYIWILAVMHLRRKPGYWQHRLS